MINFLLTELTSGIPDAAEVARIILRLLAAAALGAIVGLERERTGKAAGLRTHMMVAVSSALLVMAPIESSMTTADVSRVIQGVAAGIGFLGAGAILKLQDDREIHGLTTAAGIWMTAAVGIAAGLGRLGLAAISVAIAWVILRLLLRIESAGKQAA
jgi:putative Mg2+ transporter-C (MgtC) family protein